MNTENKFDINNNIQVSTPFPFEEVDDEKSEKYFDVEATEIIIRLTSILFSTTKPKIVMAALLYGAGVDVGIYLQCENTETDIAKQLGESKQNFSIMIKKMRKEFGLEHTNTGKNPSVKEKYKNANYKKKKYEP